MYSGRVAGEVYSQVEPADTFVVIGPNHTGHGHASTSLYDKGRWVLPQTYIDMDEEFAGELLHFSEFLSVDPQAHDREHSIEVQVPFLLLLNPRAKLVPIVMRDFDAEIFHDLGRSIAAACKKHTDRRVLLVASTDMTHYEPQTSAAQKDRAAIERILAVDPDGLRQIVDNLGISMCGVGPTAAVLSAARALGATKGRLVRYATSADVTHDENSVVGYAGVIIT
jgi:AmmeMemoRadiSam system protein B